jgi:ubiquitin-like modifier-activating enzyme ATG7
MPPLQFQSLSSQPTPSFWSALTSFKLDKLRLDDTQQTITAWLEEGRQVVDKEVASSSVAGRMVGVDGVVGVGGGAFGDEGEK